jgi:hypothetical protein
METKLKALSAKAIIDNARERFVDVDEYVNSKVQMLEQQHVLIEEADN